MAQARIFRFWTNTFRKWSRMLLGRFSGQTIDSGPGSCTIFDLDPNGHFWPDLDFQDEARDRMGSFGLAKAHQKTNNVSSIPERAHPALILDPNPPTTNPPSRKKMFFFVMVEKMVFFFRSKNSQNSPNSRQHQITLRRWLQSNCPTQPSAREPAQAIGSKVGSYLSCINAEFRD